MKTDISDILALDDESANAFAFINAFTASIVAIFNVLFFLSGQATVDIKVLIPYYILCGVSWWNIKYGNRLLGMSLFVWMGMFYAFVTAYFINGLLSPGMMMVMPLTMIAGWVMTRIGLGVLLTTFITCVVAITYADYCGLIPHVQRGLVYWAWVFVVVTGICVVIGAITANAVRRYISKTADLAKELEEANKTLESKVEERTKELQTALDTVKKMQDDLIQSEKMASLGSMIAGIAHELNTPIGNAVTVSSTLIDRADDLNTMITSGTLKKSELISIAGGIKEMGILIERSVTKAGNLVASFKQVAVDQASECRRIFDLRVVTDENLDTIRPGLKQKPYKIVNNIPPNIKCDSYPGPLGQVITNLVQNAVFHGFHDRDHGIVTVDASVENDILELSVRDDGVGMDTATSMRVFDPFFTTKLGKGGSGLGLAIVFRIVTTILAGEIKVASMSNNGTTFTVKMPLRTPGKMQ